MSRPTRTDAAGIRRLASGTVVTVVALMLVAAGATAGVNASPADHASPTTHGDGVAASETPKADNGTTTDAGGTVQVTNHDYAMPDREERKTQRAAAFAATDGNPTVTALREGSFAFARNHQYGPEGGSVEVRTWHERRVDGDWRTGVEVTYTGGYHAQVDVGPDGEVQALALSTREPATVTKQYSDAEQRVVAAALDDGSVESALAGEEYYVSRVVDAESLGVGACADAACHVVTLQRVDTAAALHVKVVAGERVVGVERADWDAEPASPDVDASAHPSVAEDDVSSTVTSPIVQDNWDVQFTNTASNGIQLDQTSHDGTQFLYQSQIPNVRLYYPDGTSFRQNLTRTDLWGGVRQANYTTGFTLQGTYYVGCTRSEWPVDGCNEYEIQWIFDESGDFDPILTVSGPGSSGFGGDPTYNVRWRLDTDIDGYTNDAVARWTGSDWSNFTEEDYFSSGSPMDPDDNELQVLDVQQGYRANLSAWDDDDPTFFALQYESVTQWSPANLVDGENVYDTDVMVYYRTYRTDCTPNDPCVPGGTWHVDS